MSGYVRMCLIQYILTYPDIYQTAYTDGWKNTIKPHVKFFLKMNTWLFETCRRQYN